MLEELVKKRLECLGFKVENKDLKALRYALGKAESRIKNDCCLNEIPEELFYIAADMAAGEYLAGKMLLGQLPETEYASDNSEGVKEIQLGDMSVSLNSGESREERIDKLINCLKESGKEELACWRKIRWTP